MLSRQIIQSTARSAFTLNARTRVGPIGTGLRIAGSSGTRLQARRLSAPAFKPVEDDLQPLPWQVTDSSVTHTLTPASLPEPTLPLPEGPDYTFASLRRRVDHDTIKALTERPFRFENMSEVQYRVLSLMPEVVGIKEKPPKGMSEVQWVESLEGEERERVERKIQEGVRKKDMLVKAKTGTGKTVAFLVPAIERRLDYLERESWKSKKNPGERADPSERGLLERALTRSTVGTLVISPTRELATQIANESIKCHTWHKLYMTQLLVGGSSRRQQIRLWKKDRKDVVVATPGRLKDLLQDPEVGQDFADALAHTGTLVLDEADTLLDMGFANDLNFIISHLPKERQTMLFSATVSPAIRKIARASLEKDHLFIDCVPENESNVHEHIPQYHTVLPTAGDQLPHVLRLLAHDQLMNPQQSKSIVFLPTLKLTQLFATFVRELSEALPHGKRTSVYEIHSKLDQDKRSRASDRFRKDTSPASILVTSDVSARGVDYPGVTRVIQIGVPSSGEQYIHRVGRTGRGGVQGGRGDLVLLPWESRFLESLNEVPIKPAKPDALKEEIEGLAQAWDQNLPEFQIRSVTPSQYGRNRSAPPATRTLTAEPYSERLEKMPEYINELLSGIDEEAIYSTFTSMLGYYIGKQDVVQISPRSILTGLQSWAVQAGGLDAPPTVSSTMLAKLGFKGDKPSGGRGGGGRGGYSGGRGGYSGGRDGQRRDAGSSNYGMRRMHTVARPGLGRRYLTISAVRRNESVPEVKENRQSDAVARTFSFLKLDLAPEEFEAKGDHSRQDEPARPIVFNKSGNQYSGRSIEAREGNFIGAYRRLSGILSRNRVRKELRLNEYHEKGSEMKRRLKSERHRRRFQDLVRQKVQLVQALYK